MITSIAGQSISSTKCSPALYNGYFFSEGVKWTVSKKLPSASKKVPNFVVPLFLAGTFLYVKSILTIRAMPPSYFSNPGH